MSYETDKGSDIFENADQDKLMHTLRKDKDTSDKITKKNVGILDELLDYYEPTRGADDNKITKVPIDVKIKQQDKKKKPIKKIIIKPIVKSSSKNYDDDYDDDYEDDTYIDYESKFYGD